MQKNFTKLNSFGQIPNVAKFGLLDWNWICWIASARINILCEIIFFLLLLKTESNNYNLSKGEPKILASQIWTSAR